MFSLASSTVLVLAMVSVSAHSISHVRHHHVPRVQPPAGWATDYLEPYDTYNKRYVAVGCENKHNSSFFDMCCHPLLASETLAANRPACCAVGATAACPSTTSSAAAPASTSADDEACDDNDSDEEDCDPEDSSAVSATQVATTSHVDVVTTSTTAKATTTTAKAKTTFAKATTSTAEATTTAAKATTASTTDTSTQTSTSSSSSFITGGFGTWFTQNGVAGACGTVHQDTDFVVALQTQMYANGANCGRKIQIIDISNGKSSEAVVADECPSCTNTNSVDMSVGLFESLAGLSVGEFDIKWQFLD
ncbi:RlpA-like double-psi beta-barrel-protein domain-containing protein-containing protein [Mycena sp. CBHHK59/15]|nr:RlpA-like double-psi beta-barrel-protein domain-containing protein-containing protein [Mycena sp. CBHHK59/15]